jgi:hypothetical protein
MAGTDSYRAHMSSYQSDTNTVMIAEQVRLITPAAVPAGVTEHLFYLEDPQSLDVMVGDELDIRMVGTYHSGTFTANAAFEHEHHNVKVADVFFEHATAGTPPVLGAQGARQYLKLGACDNYYEGVTNDLANLPCSIVAHGDLSSASASPLIVVSIDRLSPRVVWPLKFRMPNAMRGVVRLEIDSIALKNVETNHHESPGSPGDFLEPTRDHPFYSLTIDEVFTGSQEVISNVPGVQHVALAVFPTSEQDLTALPCNVLVRPGDVKHDFASAFDLQSLTVHIRDPEGKYVKCQSADIRLKLIANRKMH